MKFECKCPERWFIFGTTPVCFRPDNNFAYVVEKRTKQSVETFLAEFNFEFRVDFIRLAWALATSWREDNQPTMRMWQFRRLLPSEPEEFERMRAALFQMLIDHFRGEGPALPGNSGAPPPAEPTGGGASSSVSLSSGSPPETSGA